MSKLCKNLSYDIKVGFGGNILYYAIWGIVILFLAGTVISELGELHPEHVPSCMDILGRFLLGVDGNDIFERNEVLQFPTEWFAVQVYILLGIARFTRQDFEECGYHIWIRTRSKFAWWSSKVLWCFFHIVICYIIVLAGILLLLFIKNRGVSFDIGNLYHLNLQSVSAAEYNYIQFIMPVLVTFAVGMITMTLSFCFDGLMGLLAGVVTLMMSVFMDYEIMLGRYMMLYSYFSNQNQYSVAYGTVICVLAIVIFCFAGYLLFRRKEI